MMRKPTQGGSEAHEGGQVGRDDGVKVHLDVAWINVRLLPPGAVEGAGPSSLLSPPYPPSSLDVLVPVPPDLPLLRLPLLHLHCLLLGLALLGLLHRLVLEPMGYLPEMPRAVSHHPGGAVGLKRVIFLLILFCLFLLA